MISHYELRSNGTTIAVSDTSRSLIVQTIELGKVYGSLDLVWCERLPNGYQRDHFIQTFLSKKE
jgi:hypothetical protein